MDIIKNRKIYFVISLIIIVVGMSMLAFKGLNYGIDFTGGTLIQINVGKFISVEEVKEIIDEYDDEASILHAGDKKEEIMIRSTLDLSNDDITNIINQFIEKYNIDHTNYQSEKFEAFMGKEIKKKAMMSMAIASVAMLIYITWRFEFTFGLAAIIALVHDILIMLSFYAIFRVQVNNPFIAAILTVLGYSINDTIVIFDRIRENLKLHPKMAIDETINNSIKQSMGRTVNTTITTLIAVIVLYITGVEAVKILALPLIIGLLAGTYSSIFIASPIWYIFKNRDTIKTAR